MTLKELDEALLKIGLNFDSEAGIQARNQILENYGSFLINSKKLRCSKCGTKDKIGCSTSCPMNSIDDMTPLQSAMKHLNKPNDLNLFSFMMMFVVPVYEKITGNYGVFDKVKSYYLNRIKKQNH